MLHDPEALLTAVGPAVETHLLPVSLPFLRTTIAVAVLGDRGLAALVRPRRRATTADTLGLAVQPCGSDADEPASRLLAHVHDWAAYGRLSTDLDAVADRLDAAAQTARQDHADYLRADGTVVAIKQ